MSVDTMNAEGLHAAMVDQLVADHADKGLAMRPEVETALRTVRRHLFTPDAPLEEAYRADQAVVTKRRGDEAVSSVSAPWLIAEMLGQAADVIDGGLLGRHVLEIGSGGYNAALLRELVGPAGSVTTVDIDSDVTDRATACLAAAGYNDVTVVCADAEQQIGHGRSYDLIIVTVGAWDIPPAWTEQLAETGTLVVPLRTFGMTRSWALRRAGDRLTSHSQRLCGFVSMQGSGALEMRYVDIAAGVHLRLDELGQQAIRRPSARCCRNHRRRNGPGRACRRAPSWPTSISGSRPASRRRGSSSWFSPPSRRPSTLVSSPRRGATARPPPCTTAASATARR